MAKCVLIAGVDSHCLVVSTDAGVDSHRLTVTTAIYLTAGLGIHSPLLTVTSFCLSTEISNKVWSGLHAGVDSVGRIESFFDAISYQKGGSVIRMLRAFLNNQRVGDEQYGLRRSLLQVCYLLLFFTYLLICLFIDFIDLSSTQHLYDTATKLGATQCAVAG